MDSSQQSKIRYLVDTLLEDINSGKYQKTRRLPSLCALSRSYKVSRSTVHCALTQLVECGAIYAQRGRGYFVKSGAAPGAERNILIFNRPGAMYYSMFEDILEFTANHPEVTVTVESIRQSPEALQKRIELLIAQGLDTIFFNGISSHELGFMEQYMGRLNLYGFFNLPSFPNSQLMFLPGVYSDWVHGGYIGTRHLFDCGCQRIILFFSSPGDVQEDCLKGAMAAAEDAPAPVEIITLYDQETANGTRISCDCLREYLPSARTGIFCFTHAIAFRVYDWLKSNGYNIPQHVPLLEYYDSEQSLLFSPPVSSLSLCQKEMSKALFDMFINRRKQYLVIKPKLVKRESTAIFPMKEQ